MAMTGGSFGKIEWFYSFDTYYCVSLWLYEGTACHHSSFFRLCNTSPFSRLASYVEITRSRCCTLQYVLHCSIVLTDWLSCATIVKNSSHSVKILGCTKRYEGRKSKEQLFTPAKWSSIRLSRKRRFCHDTNISFFFFVRPYFLSTFVEVCVSIEDNMI